MSQNNTEFQTNKEWSDNFSPEILRYLEAFFYPYKFTKGEIEEDRNQCCDFKATNGDFVIASRMRDYSVYQKYPYDITISTKTSLNGKSELDKIIEGFGDYYFYGFATPNNLHILSWRLYDLNVFRLWAFKLAKDKTLPTENVNLHFIPFNATLVQNIIVAFGGRNEYNPFRISAIKGIV